jgi:hypothetical protein
MTDAGRRLWLIVAIACAAAISGVFVGLLLPKPRPAFLPSLPPLSSQETVLKGTPDVVVAVRNLSRLESAAYHMERVIDLSDKQSHLFGLVTTEDAILLVAVADVTAGVDLARLGADDIVVSKDGQRVSIALPPAELFHTALDSERTYVHTRRTGMLARRKETLEGDARKQAERALSEAALKAEILSKADENARRVVTELVRSLGFRDVHVVTRPIPQGSEAR